MSKEQLLEKIKKYTALEYVYTGTYYLFYDPIDIFSYFTVGNVGVYFYKKDLMINKDIWKLITELLEVLENEN